MVTYLVFFFDSPLRFIGGCIILCFGLAFLRILALMLAAVFDGVGSFRLFEVNHYHIEGIEDGDETVE